MRLRTEIIGLLFLLYAENVIWLCNAPLSYTLVANVVLVAIYFGLLFLFKKIGGFENE